MKSRIIVKDFRDEGRMLTDSFLEWYTKGKVDPERYVRGVFFHLCAYGTLLRGKHYRHLYRECLEYLTWKHLLRSNNDPNDVEEYERMKRSVEEVYKIHVKYRRDEVISKDRYEYEPFLAMRQICWLLPKNEEA